VNGAGDTIVKLSIQFRQLIRLIEASLCYVPDSSGFDNVTNDEFLDGFVLGNATSAIGAADWIHMAATMLGTSTISAFASLANKQKRIRYMDINSVSSQKNEKIIIINHL